MKKLYYFFLLLCFPGLTPAAHAQRITTIAGDTARGYNGDGIAATSAELNQPYFMTVDGSGNVYFLEDSGRIRKISTSGIISTVAGNGTIGFSGNGGPASAAVVGNLSGIAVDGAGNIYFSDLWSNCVRKINTSGIITAFAGVGMSTPGTGGDGGSATAATFNQPGAITVDKHNNVYITDFTNSSIRKVDAMGVITTVDSNVPTGFLAVDTSDNIYSTNGTFIVKIDPTGAVTNIAGCHHGPCLHENDTSAADSIAFVGCLSALAVDNVGNIYTLDACKNHICKINTAGIMSIIAGSGTRGFSADGTQALSADLQVDYGLAIDHAGKIYFTEMEYNRVRTFYLDPAVVTDQSRIETGLTIYPNPSSGIFTMSLSSASGAQADITIMSLDGRKVKEFTAATNEEKEVQLNTLPGTYFIIAATAEGRACRQIVIK